LLLLDEHKSQMHEVLCAHACTHTWSKQTHFVPVPQEMKEYLMERRVLPVYIPGGCTDLLQPVDHHFGAQLKNIMNQFYKVSNSLLRTILCPACEMRHAIVLRYVQSELEDNFDAWRDYTNNSSLSDSQRRIYLAQWLDLSWGLLRHYRGFIRKCFDPTVLVKKDGSHELRLKRLHRAYTPLLQL
jgi:hypothetical protein